MPLIDPEICERCLHERNDHIGNKCNSKDCNCDGFWKFRTDPVSARNDARKRLRDVAAALVPTCETREQLAKEMLAAVQRFILEEIKR